MIAVPAMTFAQEQSPQRPESPSAEEMIKRATKALGLTEAQVKEWEAIHEKYHEVAEKECAQAESNRKKMGEALGMHSTKM